VILFASTSEAYASLLKVLCDAGDNVLVPAPSYPLFAHLAAFEQVQLRTYPLRYDGAWHIDMPALRAACTDRTRAVFVVSPNNPTGSYLKASELEALAALGLPVVSDEVFAEYPLRESNERVRTVAGSTLPLSFALAGLSKLSGFPQMKAAWCAVSGEARHKHEAMRRLELVCDTFLGVGAPVQAALEDLLALGHNVRASIRTRTQTNLSLLRKALADTPASVLDVEGGWYAVVRLPATKSEDEWVLGLLGTHRVLVHPGAFFDFDSEPFCVVSLLPAPLAFADGVEALRQSAMDA
jgi:aspartate/methionine/tyrosine aminotransferase